MEDAFEDVETPYWHLEEDTDGPPSLRRVLGRLPVAVRPILSTAWRVEPRATLTVAVLQVVVGVATAGGLLATTSVLTELLTGGPTGPRVLAALPALALVIGVLSVRGLLDTGVALAHARITPSVRWQAEQQLIGAALDLPLSAYDDPAFYDQLHRARDRGLFHLEMSVDCLLELLGSTIAVLAAAASLSVLNPILLPVLVLAVLPNAWAVLSTARMGYDSMTRTVALDRRATMIAELAVEREPAAEIRACQAEPFVRNEYRAAADPLRTESIRLGTVQARARAYGRALAGVGMAVTFVVLGVLLSAGWIPLAVAGTAVIAIRAVTGALDRLVLAGNQLFERSLYIADFQDFVTDAARRSGRGDPAKPRPDAPQRIELRDVGFRYPGETGRPDALRHIDLTITAGETIALVGENGSGKTTLAKLIGGLYPPSSGSVRWDGADLAELDRAGLADQVVMVLQDPVRWPHDARTNVTVGRHQRPDPDGKWLRRAAGQARADQVVAGLVRGWKTLLSTQFRGGQDLSGGQWQRLAVARGLYRDAPLLIWDEPTAPLDAKAEFAVYESLRKLARDRTVVLITHRLASVRHADRIYLLHDGEVVEQGSHDELHAAGGRYTELYDLQARLFLADFSDVS